jgi:hypothetical protein
VELGAGITKALLASGQGTEVLDSLGNNVVEKFKVDATLLCCVGISDECLSVFVESMRTRTARGAIDVGDMEGQHSLTLDAALGSDIARLVDLNLRTLPRDIEVRFDGHVVCRRSEESFVGWGSNRRGTCTESRSRDGGTQWGLHCGGWRGDKCAKLQVLSDPSTSLCLRREKLHLAWTAGMAAHWKLVLGLASSRLT